MRPQTILYSLLCGAVAETVAALDPQKDNLEKTVPGAFIVEFEDSHVSLMACLRGFPANMPAIGLVCFLQQPQV